MTWKTTGADPEALYNGTEFPSLDLKFADNKTLVDEVSGSTLVSHQRSMSGSNGAGTFVNSSGLVEESKTNLLAYSDVSFPGWFKSGVFPTVQESGFTDPEGGTNAAKITFAGAFNSQIQNNTGTFLSGVQYTYSIYAKATSGTQGFYLFIYDGGDYQSQPLTATTEWQRFSFTHTGTAGAAPSVRVRAVTPSGGEELLVWGTQLEIGSTATTYIPTTTVPSAAPRFDHDPVTGESLGLLIEESRTNYQPYSSSVPTAYSLFPSGTVNTTAPTAATAPDGTSTTDALIESLQTNVQHSIVDAVINTFETSTGVWTYSVFAKLVSGTRLFASRIYGAGSNSVYVEYNLLTGTSSNGSSANVNVVSHGMDEYPNGWWRCWVTFNAPGTQEGWLLGLANGDAAELPFYDGDGTSGVYIWGAQVEAGSFPTSYIPTSGSTVTRAEDVAEITGSNFSSWYNQSEGTIYSELASQGGGGLPTRFQISDGGGNRLQARVNQFYSYNGAQQFNLSYTSTLKEGFAFSNASVSVAASGSIAATYGASSLPISTTLELGKRSSLDYLNGHISRFTYYPYRLSDTRLQTITT